MEGMVLPGFPFRVEFEVTSSCNLRCSYCYAMPFTNETPPLERLVLIFEKTKAEADPFEVVLVGGEPFLRRDFLDVAEAASSIFGKTIGVSTNGTLLSALPEDKIARLKRMVDDGRMSLQISLDSTDPSVDNITRGMGAKVMESLDRLERLSIRFSVGIVLTTHNKSDVHNTVNRLLSEYHSMNHINLETLQPTLHMGEEYWRAKIRGGDAVTIRSDTLTQIEETGRSDVTLSGIVANCFEGDQSRRPALDRYGFKTCTAGLVRAGVFTNGDVTPCLTVRTVSLGNLYSESWKDIWERSKKRFLRLDKEGVVGSQCSAINQGIRKGEVAVTHSKAIG